jgi:two-component system chemotaxis response regulator CheY
MPTVLIVDDARLMRNIIKGILVEEMDCNVIEAANGDEAVELYERHSPDAVTMDITMEQQNGVDAARAILAYDCNANIVIVTSMGQERLLEECLAAGVRDFIVKPFARERVRNAVSHALKYSRSPARQQIHNTR